MKILVIDDDEMMLKIMSSKLSKRGYEVITATQAEEALAYMTKTAARPDYYRCNDAIYVRAWNF